MAIRNLLWQEISNGHKKCPIRLRSFAMQVGGSGGRSPPGKQRGFGGAAGPPNGGPSFHGGGHLRKNFSLDHLRR